MDASDRVSAWSLHREHLADALRATGTGAVEVVEGPQDEAALAELRRRREAGTRIVLALPNEDDHDLERARALEASLDARLLYQHAAEGSVLLGAAATGAARIEPADAGEPEHAVAFVLLAGFGDDDVAAALAELRLVVTPEHTSRVLALTAANRELLRANRALSRGWLGKADAAGASVLDRYEARDRAQTERIAELEAEVERRIAEVLEVGDDRAEIQHALHTIRSKKLVRAALKLDALRPSQRWR